MSNLLMDGMLIKFQFLHPIKKRKKRATDDQIGSFLNLRENNFYPANKIINGIFLFIYI